MGIKQSFNQGASEYDSARKQLIPCFDDFYGTVVDLVDSHPHKKLSILDLGAGTGLLTDMLQATLPTSHFTLVDISDKMLEQAKLRFANNDISIDYHICDYSLDQLQGQYDIIVSALSIHHLTNNQKKDLFCKIYNALNMNGLFINADQALGETSAIENFYKSSWLKQVRQRGVDEEALAKGLERMKEDKMAPLSLQLQFLRQAGFVEVNTWYQFCSFTVYSGMK